MLIYITGCPTRFLGSVKMKVKLMKCENVTKSIIPGITFMEWPLTTEEWLFNRDKYEVKYNGEKSTGSYGLIGLILGVIDLKGRFLILANQASLLFKACSTLVSNTIFFPRVILYNFFLFWLIYGGLGFGVLGLGSYIGFVA